MYLAPRILLVEDDESLRELFAEFLRDEGFNCDTAENGLIATERLQVTNYDMLVSDFRMSKMNGLELINWCREHNFHFPVLLITATTNFLPHEIEALNRCRANLLPKPVSLERLLETLKMSLFPEQINLCLA